MARRGEAAYIWACERRRPVRRHRAGAEQPCGRRPERGARGVVVTVAGEIGILTDSVLRPGPDEALTRTDLDMVIVDLSEVGFFGSSGFAILAQARSTAREHATASSVVAAPDSVPGRSLYMMGLKRPLGTYARRAAALGAHGDPG